MRGNVFGRCAAVVGLVLASAAVSVAADGDKPQVDNPAYQMWAKFKPGSTAKYAMNVTLPTGGSQSMEMSFTLESVDAAAAKVMTKVGMAGAGGGRDRETTVAAKTDAEKKFPEPTGTEDVKVGEKTYHCKVFEMKGTGPIGSPTGRPGQPTGDAQTKLWACDEVPGGVVKMHTDVTVPQMGNAKVSTEMTLTECAAK